MIILRKLYFSFREKSIYSMMQLSEEEKQFCMMELIQRQIFSSIFFISSRIYFFLHSLFDSIAPTCLEIKFTTMVAHALLEVTQI